MYMVYINGVQLPVTPSKLTIKTKSNNKVVNLINDGDVSILKNPGLAEIEFEALLPRKPYPFSTKIVLDPSIYLKGLELLKTEKKVFQFIVVRLLPNGIPLFPTNIKCTLEDYTSVEDSNNGFDVKVQIKLKQYKHFGLKEVVIDEQSANTDKTKVSVKNSRDTETAPKNTQYTVKQGDCLYNIAKKNLGNGARWKEIFNLNKDKINNPDLIYPNQKLVLPT